MVDDNTNSSNTDQTPKTDIDLRRDTAVIRTDAASESTTDTQAMQSRRTITIVVYVLQALGFVSGITSIVAIVINYVKRSDMEGTWLASHFRWQIRTFWFGLLWGFVGAALAAFYIGLPILLAAFIWVIYRIVRGLLAVIDHKPMYQT